MLLKINGLTTRCRCSAAVTFNDSWRHRCLPGTWTGGRARIGGTVSFPRDVSSTAILVLLPVWRTKMLQNRMYYVRHDGDRDLDCRLDGWFQKRSAAGGNCWFRSFVHRFWIGGFNGEETCQGGWCALLYLPVSCQVLLFQKQSDRLVWETERSRPTGVISRCRLILWGKPTRTPWLIWIVCHLTTTLILISNLLV